MSKPLGSVLDGVFWFSKANILADPSPLPTVIVCAKPDGTTVSPPALTHLATGIFYASQLFSATDTAALTGFYVAAAGSSDATIDNPLFEVEWEVETVDKTGYSLSVAGILAIWNQLTTDAGIIANSFAAFIKTLFIATSYTAPLDANQTAVAVLDVSGAAHNLAGTIGKAINDAGAGGDPAAIATAVWDTLNAAHVITGSQSAFIAAILTKLNTISGANITFISPVVANADTTIYKSRDFNSADGMQLTYATAITIFNTDTFPWNGGPYGSPWLILTGTYVDANHCSFNITRAQGAALNVSDSTLEVVITRSGREIEAVVGNLHIKNVVVL